MYVQKHSNENIKWCGNYANYKLIKNNIYMKILIIPELRYEFQDIQSYELIGDVNQNGKIILLGNSGYYSNKKFCELTCYLHNNKLYGDYIFKMYHDDDPSKFICTTLSNDGIVESKLIILRAGANDWSTVYTYNNNKLINVVDFTHQMDISMLPKELNVKQLLNSYTTILGYSLVSNECIDHEHGVCIIKRYSANCNSNINSNINSNTNTILWDPSNNKQYYYRFDKHGILSTIYHQDSINPLTMNRLSQSNFFTYNDNYVTKLFKTFINKFKIPKIPKTNNSVNINVDLPAVYMGTYQVNGFPHFPPELRDLNLIPFKGESERTIYRDHSRMIIKYNRQGTIIEIIIPGSIYAGPGSPLFIPNEQDDNRSGTLKLIKW